MFFRLLSFQVFDLFVILKGFGRFLCVLACVVWQSNSWADSAAEQIDEEVKQLDTLVTVGEESREVQLEQSAAAVDVVNFADDQKLTADLSEVLSREPGISIRRMGGLGSRESFSLNGLRDEQVRFFIDGVPIDMSAYTFGISSIPVNLIESAEVYHGVVPISLGADALGGAVNLVTDKGDSGTGGSVSYMTGDFNTHRSSFNLKYADGQSGFFSRLNGFYDYSDNNYEIDVELPNELGQREPASVKRFHDAYEGQGVSLDLGYRNKRWADLLQLSLYTSKYYSEIQNNVTMSKPYGEPTIERKADGLNLQYQQSLTNDVSIKVIGGLSKIKSEFVDVADYSYTWTGEEIITPVPHPGEIADPCDCAYWRDNQFAIAGLDWKLAAGHKIALSAAPTWNQQSARNDYLADGSIDPIDADREMFSLVLGANYTLDLLFNKLQNEFFVKRYSQDRKTEQVNTLASTREQLDSGISRFGWGNATRYYFNDWLIGKISYEQATRLPGFEEVFGNSENIIPNVELDEEYSNNYNASLSVSGLRSRYGSWKGEVGLFLRDVEDAIFLMTVNDVSQYQNIASVDSRGFQLSGSWSSLDDFIDVHLNYTDFDLINTADKGLFAQFKNERVPNQPYRFFNAGVGLNWIGIFSGYDTFEIDWNYRYVDRFDLLWGDQGLAQFNPYVPVQKSHSLATTYSKDFFSYTLTFSAEAQNVTDEKLYDHYGVQRPGRAYYFKAIVEF